MDTKEKLRRWLSAMLCLCMVLSVINNPIQAWANELRAGAEPAETVAGTVEQTEAAETVGETAPAQTTPETEPAATVPEETAAPMVTVPTETKPAGTDNPATPMSILPGGNKTAVIQYRFYNKLSADGESYDPNGEDQLIFSQNLNPNNTLTGPERTPRSSADNIFIGWQVREIVVTTKSGTTITYTADSSETYEGKDADFATIITLPATVPILNLSKILLDTDPEEFSPGVSGEEAGDQDSITVRLYAAFDDQAYIRFFDDTYDVTKGPNAAGNGRVVDSVRGEPGSTVDLSQHSYTPEEGHVVTGWLDVTNVHTSAEESRATRYDTNDIITLGENAGDLTVLKAIVEEGYWITYNSRGGSIVEPVYYKLGEQTSAPAQPTRIGYTFDGWYDAATGGTKYTFGNQLNGNVTLYAHWTANPSATFTVAFWKQNVNDDVDAATKTYDYWFSATSPAVTVGRTIAVENRQNSSTATGTGTYTVGITGTNYIGNRDYTGFYYASADTGKTVSADGSTVVNVYFDRQKFVINFLQQTGIIRPTTEILYTWTGLYGATFDPAKDQVWDNNYKWRQDSNSGTVLTFLDAFLPPAGMTSATNNTWTLNLYRNTQDNNYYIYHYLENLDGSYTLKLQARFGGGTWNSSNKFEGYTASYYGTNANSVTNANQRTAFNVGADVSAGRNGGNLYIFNTLNTSNTFTLINVWSDTANVQRQTTINTYNPKYTQPLVDFKPASDPALPSEAPDYLAFKGWYLNPEGTVPFDFDTATMPSVSLAVYAVWEPKVYTVSFDLNNGTAPQGHESDGLYDAQRVSGGRTATEPEYPPVREGNFSFAGWHVGSVTGQLFNFDTLITKNYTAEEGAQLIAAWYSPDWFTLVYDPGEEGYVSYNGKTIESPDDHDDYIDPKSYNEGGRARIFVDAIPYDDTENVFLGWGFVDPETGKVPEGSTLYGSGRLVDISAVYADFNGDDNNNRAPDEGLHGVITLRAVYGVPSTDTVTVTLHTDFPEDSEFPEGSDGNEFTDYSNGDVVENKEYTLPNPTTDDRFGWVAPIGYKFAGWSRTENSNSADDVDFIAGDVVMADSINMEDENHLYAVWVPIQGNLTITKNVVTPSGTGIVNRTEFSFTVTKWDNDKNAPAEPAYSQTVTVTLEGGATTASTTLKGLEYGTYKVEETAESAQGYIVTYDVQTTAIENEGETVTVTVTNTEPFEKLTVAKQADTEGPVALGDTITYTLTVTNEGNLPLKGATVTDELPGIVVDASSLPNGVTYDNAGKFTIASLEPGDEVTITYTYTVTAADVQAGQVKNTATTSTGETSSATVTTEEAKPSLESTKTLTNEGTGEDNAFKVGDTAEFDIVVKNTGNTVQSNVTVTEALSGATITAVQKGENEDALWGTTELQYTPDDITDGTTSVTITTIPVGASVVIKAKYTLTQADIDSEDGVINTVTVDGQGDTPDPTEPIPTEKQDPDLKVTKTANVTGPVSLGQVITYTLTVKNEGNVTLKGATVTDELPGIVVGNLPDGVTYNEGVFTIASIAPETTITITYTYTVTLDDMLKDSIVNTAVTSTEDDDDVTLTTGKGSLSISKTVEGTDAKDAEFTFTVKLYTAYNNETDNALAAEFSGTYGDATFTGGVATVKIQTASLKGSAAITDLPAGLYYTVTEAEVEGYVLTNSSGSGTVPADGTVTASFTNYYGQPNEKVLNGDHEDGVQVGDELTYTIYWANNNNTPADVTVTDTLGAGLAYVSHTASGDVEGTYDAGTNTITWELGQQDALASGSMTVTVRVTEAALQNGEVENDATIKVGESETHTKTVTTDVQANGKLTISKAVVSSVAADDEIGFTFTVVLKDAGGNALTGSYKTNGTPATVSNGNTITLKKGESITIEGLPAGATYTVTETNVPSDFTPTATGDEGTITADGEAKAEFTNTRKVIGSDEIEFTKTAKVNGADLTEAVAGDTITYTITFTNNSDATAKNVVIVDTLPAGLEPVDGTISDDGDYDKDAHTITWKIDEVAAKGTVTVSFDVVLPALSGTVTPDTAATTWKNEARVTFDNMEDPTDAPDDDVDIEQTAPNVEISKTQAVSDGTTESEKAETQNVRSGDQVIYYITVENTGNGTAKNVVITDEIPVSKDATKTPLVLVEGTISDGGTLGDDGKTITWKLGDLEPGETVTVKFTVTIPDVSETTEWENIAAVSYDNQPDNDPDDGKDPDDPKSDPTETVANPYWLTIYKAVTGDSGEMEREFQFTVELSHDTIDLAAEYPCYYVDADGNGTEVPGTITLNGGKATVTLKAGERVTIEGLPNGTKYTVTEEDYSSIGYSTTADGKESLSTSGEIVADSVLDEGTNRRVLAYFVNHRDAATVEVTKTAEMDGEKVTQVYAGDTITYVIDVKNTGDVDAYGVQAIDTLPKGLVPEEDTISDGGVYDAAKGTVTWDIGILKAHESVQFSFQVTVPQVTEKTSWVNVVTAPYENPKDPDDPIDPPADEEEIFEGMPELVLNMTQALNGGAETTETQIVKAGDVVTYFITVRNNGNAEARGTVVRDEIPAGLVLVNGSVSDDGKETDGVITWNVGMIPVGESMTVCFQVTVPAANEETTWENAAAAACSNTMARVNVMVSSNSVKITEKLPHFETVDKEASINGGAPVSGKQTVKAGDKVTYTIRVTNNGDGAATNVEIVDKIPEGLILVKDSISDGGKLDEAGKTITWTVDVLEVGETVAVSFTVTVPAITTSTKWENIAYLNHDHWTDPDDSDGATGPSGKPGMPSNEVDITGRPATDVPKTGDMFDPTRWTTMMITSLFGSVAMLYVLTTKKHIVRRRSR